MWAYTACDILQHCLVGSRIVLSRVELVGSNQETHTFRSGYNRQVLWGHFAHYLLDGFALVQSSAC